MADTTEQFDDASTHRRFSALAFNHAWELMEKPHRSPADDEEMIATAFASLWHWMQRADRTDKNLAVGYWQISRILALLHRGEESLRYAQLSLQLSTTAEPFYLAYAHEAIARAAKLLGKSDLQQYHTQLALDLAAKVSDAEERQTLEADLKNL